MDQSFGKPQSSPSSESINKKYLGLGNAHSKIILMGEHSVVYDYPAIAIPFKTCQVKVKITPSAFTYSTIDCPYFKGRFDQAPAHLNNLKMALKLTLDSKHLPHYPLHIEILSEIPQERGMGSSAAVSVALIRAVCDYYGKSIKDYHLRMITNEAEVIAHQSTSGIDTLVTSSNRSIIYRKSQQARDFELDLQAYLVVADSGQAGQTKLAVNHVAQLRKSKAAFVNSAMETIGSFVSQAFLAIRKKDPVELGRLMTYNHYYLNQLGVSNASLDHIVNAAWLAGSLGAKLTGGGMGGCVIALAHDQTHAQLIAESMEQAGAEKTWLLNLSKANQAKESHHV
ncbi:mevalonate kinase [Facklamia miroungae]|uniref:Mevalonate kinase n=1 Tax=Facklamia miroungae TaxID=120956 RepID=A0A1G7RFX3_9LACT|nr:mevalonate kinase [Facklamia miroungae]NKZ29427.1 mevalonate kinase [Facklamia miroungae]SDG09677.1 mevalonate kinase [Facklamia miroungae]